MSEKTQECSADQVSRAEITSQDLLRELMKAELRHLRIRNLQEEEKLFADARANEAIEKKAAAANISCPKKRKIAPPRPRSRPANC
jgi:hypothetical protein